MTETSSSTSPSLRYRQGSRIPARRFERFLTFLQFSLNPLNHPLKFPRMPRAGLLRGRLAGTVLSGTFLAAAVLAGNAVAATPLAACPTAGQAGALQGDLPRLAARFNKSRALKIVTIGSSSTAGAGASSPANSYPSQLESDLLRRFPGHDVDVVNAGANGQEVPDMLARLERDVLAHKPDLVIWQFGSNGLLRGRELAGMEVAARIGIARIKASGADVILMDLQHAPRIDGVAARDDILKMMERLSTSTHAALFHRYRLMKAWAVAMGSGYGAMVATDRLHMTDTSYRCMAGALAASLQSAMAPRVATVKATSLATAVGTRPSPGRAPSRP